MKTKTKAKSKPAAGLSATSTETLTSMLTVEAERDPHTEVFILRLSQRVPLPGVEQQILRLRRYAKSRRKG